MLVSLAALALLAPSSASADLAHGKPATASSTYSSTYQPGYAVDGDSNTRWSSNFTDNQWWQVDLGSVQQVNAAAINWENAYASHYRISVSTDGTNFTTVSDVNITKPGSQQTSFSTVSARYVRITGVTRATQYGISFWEAQVYGPSSPAPSGPLPSGFRDSAVFTGLANPTALRFAPFPDGRAFVAQKDGVIKEYDSLSDTTPTTVANLGGEVHTYWDRGLLGLAVDPQWPSRPYIYVDYTYDAPIGGTPPTWGDACPTPPGPTTDGCVVSGRLSRLTIDPATNTMTSEKVLINDWCQQFPSHSQGSLAIGPDGALYMSSGEGANFNYSDYGQAGNPKNPCGDPPAGVGGTETLPTAEGGSLRSQDLRTSGDPAGLDGSVIRVDPDTGAGRSDNPFASSSDANARRILAEGLRNPFRFTFRPGTNELWLGDVGANTWEEIDRLTSLTSFKNFGWPCYEGSPQNSGFSSANICQGLYSNTANPATAPYFSYQHGKALSASDPCPTTNGSSITGLAFYTGSSYPSAYNNALFFEDHTRNCLWVAKAGSNGLPDMSTADVFDSKMSNPVDLVTGPGGDLFYVNHEGGTVQRITYTSSTNQPPTAKITTDRTNGPTPLTVNFDGSGSTDPEGGALTYSWDLNGDGTFGDSTSAKPSHTYNTAGTYTAKLKVTDSQGATDTASVTITAGNSAPKAVIDTPTSSTTYKVGDLIRFSGHATDPEQGNLPASGLSWSLIIHHCPPEVSGCHTHGVQDFANVASGSFNAPDHGYPSYLELQLTATDSGGLSNTTSVRIDPQTASLNFATQPSGLQLTVDDVVGTTPFSRTVVVGSQHSLGAAAQQTLSGSSYDFSSWSDGGGASHNITASGNGSYAATYTQNLGLGKPATASSSYSSSNPPGSAVDGDSTTRWSSAFSDNQWWQVDLGAAKQVGQVSVDWENAYASEYLIKTSTDGTNFSTAADVKVSGPGVHTTTFPAVSARYVRVQGVTRATKYGISFWEAKVSAPPPPPPGTAELAHGQPTSASSTYSSSYPASRAVDGNSETRWSSAFSDNQWWQVDLGAAKQVNQVRLNWENAYASEYLIKTSTDGTNFTTAADVKIGSSGLKTTSFPAVSARYVRIQAVSRATTYGVSFWEAQVFGPGP